MLNVIFYCATVLIWGSTWLAIKFQLGTIAPVVSICWRFGLASLLLLGFCLLRRLPLRFSAQDQLFIALQGISLFALNYLCFYLAELQITSGLAAVVFSTIVVMNIVNGRIFLSTPLEWRVLLGGGFGLCGLGLLFWPELVAVHFSGAVVSGLLLSIAATYLASLGNILSARNQRAGLPVIQTNAWGMSYGTLCMLAVALASGAPLQIDTSPAYLLSLAYLAIFGSVIAFGCYLSLIGRIGAGRAAYSTLLFPLVALLLSTIWEGYRWTPAAIGGVLLIAGGNWLALLKKPLAVPVGNTQRS
ncbi:DMT family transporter [Geopsychrobacter electrodiphilus]|uniref:DMT family transporter n=1 Tax=Geopsychrobacter electrodiphilus TaxID=225196 RepID=UPI00037ACD4C|nr:EamA family transporter [Geopsychrobacter electrodiphilus]